MGIFEEKFIRTKINVSTKTELLDMMTTELFKEGILKSKDSFLKSINERETILPTGIGHGIAIPHSRHHDVNAMKALVYILSNELDYDAIDGSMVRIVIMLAIPPNHNHDYMMVLHSISVALKEEISRQAILTCESPAQVLDFFNVLHLEKTK